MKLSPGLDNYLIFDHRSVFGRDVGGRRSLWWQHLVARSLPAFCWNSIVSLEPVLNHVVLDAEPAAAEVAQEGFLA
jgi:hypothetical protein